MNAQEALLKALSARLNADGTVQVHRSVLAAEIGSSARTTDRALKALRDAGELETVTGGRFGTPTVYRLVSHSAPTPQVQRAIHSAPQENVQIAQRATKRVMCTAGCRYPLDRIWIQQGIDMHPWCELGVTSSHATPAQLQAAVHQAARDEHTPGSYGKAA